MMLRRLLATYQRPLRPQHVFSQLQWKSTSPRHVIDEIAATVEKQLMSQAPGALAIRELSKHVPDALLDDLDIGIAEVLCEANEARMARYLETANASYPNLFMLNTDKTVSLASRKQIRASMLAAAGCQSNEELQLLITKRDRAQRTHTEPPALVAPRLEPPFSHAPPPAHQSPSIAPTPPVDYETLVRVLLECLPSFHVPLHVAASEWVAAGCPLGAARLEEETLQRINLASSGEDLSDAFRSVVRQHDSYVDLVGPWASPPPMAPPDLPEYVAVLPPFQAFACKEADAGTLIDYAVRDYDAYRLARYTSTTMFVTVASLRTCVSSVLEKDVLQVALSRPLMFEYLPPQPQASWPRVEARTAEMPDGKLVCNVGALLHQDPAASGLPNLASATPGMASVNDPQYDAVDMSLGAIRFLLSEAELSATMGGVPPDLAVLTIQDLGEVMKALQRARKCSKTRLEMAKTFGLRKPPPPGPGLAKFKHKVIRAMLRQRFPHGTVFMDRNVLAYFIFDSLPTDTAVEVLKFRQAFLPEDGRTVFPISSDFVNSFKHLWQARQAANTDWIIQRADSSNLPPPDVPENYTDDDVIASIIASAPGGEHFDPNRPTSVSTVMSRLPEVLRQYVWKNYTNIIHLLEKHPKHFTVVDHENFKWNSVRPPAA